MRHDFYLAWRYLCHNKIRSAILILCLGVMAALPLALHLLLDEGERAMTARAAATPLLVGGRGSALDLTLNALYFTPPPVLTTMAEVDRIAASGWADPLPVYTRFRVRGLPLVGVSLDYFEFRGLVPERGELPAILGDCELGADAAETLGLKSGDHLPTTPDNSFDLAGIYPLQLKVAGILAKSHSPDDRAVFVDLQTAWVIEGLGHGHAEPNQTATGPFGVDQGVTKLVTYTEITQENLASFHFHGDPSGYPISAIIALPHDHRSSVLLRGRYVDEEQKSQIVLPLQTTRSLLENIFRIGALFDAVLAPLVAATLLIVSLVFALSLRLRQREIETIHLMGCCRLAVARLIAAEILLIALAGSALGFLLLQATRLGAPEFVRDFVVT